jgi:hypothetical protein
MELMSFVYKGKSYQADKGCFDDMVMTLVIFAWFTTQETFQDIFHGGRSVAKELYEKRIRETLEDLPAPVIIDDGINTFQHPTDMEPNEEIVSTFFKSF